MTSSNGSILLTSRYAFNRSCAHCSRCYQSTCQLSRDEKVYYRLFSLPEGRIDREGLFFLYYFVHILLLGYLNYWLETIIAHLASSFSLKIFYSYQGLPNILIHTHVQDHRLVQTNCCFHLVSGGISTKITRIASTIPDDNRRIWFHPDLSVGPWSQQNAQNKSEHGNR